MAKHRARAVGNEGHVDREWLRTTRAAAIDIAVIRDDEKGRGAVELAHEVRNALGRGGESIDVRAPWINLDGGARAV